jgi:SEC-C motif domain protein
MGTCPCGSNKKYNTCCEPYIIGKKIPSSPEQLMRSRYSAYTLANVNYIKKTMSGKAAIGFNESNAKEWASRVSWIGLSVNNTYNDTSTKGFVDFSAKFIDDGKLQAIEELSEFILENGKWFYVDGKPSSKIDTSLGLKVSRNSTCPCGSQKKFKNCHGGVKKPKEQ